MIARIPRVPDGRQERRAPHLAPSTATRPAVPEFGASSGAGQPSTPLRSIPLQRVDVACRFARLRPSLHLCRSRMDAVPKGARRLRSGEGPLASRCYARPECQFARRTRNGRTGGTGRRVLMGGRGSLGRRSNDTSGRAGTSQVAPRAHESRSRADRTALASRWYSCGTYESRVVTRRVCEFVSGPTSRASPSRAA
jgi:hypothetical protein